MSNANTFRYQEPTKIPDWIKEKLHAKVRLYGKERWFPKAWADYIRLCRTMPVRELPDPDAFFEKRELENGVSFAEKDDNSFCASEKLNDLEDFEEEEDDDILDDEDEEDDEVEDDEDYFELDSEEL